MGKFYLPHFFILERRFIKLALFKIFEGTGDELDKAPIHEGYAYFLSEDGTMFIDTAD
jgi:hypothetical protein